MSYETLNQSVPISKISFQVLTNKQIKNMSVVKSDVYGINQTDTFTDGQATRGGLLDPRLGTTELGILCATCGLNSSHCYGHFGHTDLVEPVFHFGYLEIVKNVLSCICLRCSKLLIYKNEEEMKDVISSVKKGKNRFAEIKKLTSNVSYCARTDQNCGVPVAKIKKDVKKGSGVIQIIAETNLQNIGSGDEGPSADASAKKKKIREILTPRMVYDILKNVSDEDYRIMGFDPAICRPEDFIIKAFPIPPIAIRPSVKMSMSSSTNYEDMLISKLMDIIKMNIRIRKQIDKETTGDDNKYLDLNISLLQYHVATYFDNENMSLPKSEQKSGGKPTKSISDRIRGKTGRIRGNLMGKRVDFSARTVITSDPNLSLDELGVPIKIAMNITFPEVVTLYNIDEMNKLVKNGRSIYPGANSVIPSNKNGRSHLIDLRYRKKGIRLRPGDIVERHIKDGDTVLFNRQPSLHKLSMMGHRVKVINDDRLATFRINVSVTTPYNADFDGDEMNMFVPQQIQTQMELANICNVSKHIITPRYSGTIIKLKQDTVVGSYIITEKKVEVDWKDAMNILMNCTNIDTQLEKLKKVNIDTHKLFSAIIPPTINYESGDKIEIKNSELIKGTVNGSILNENIIGNSWDRHGPALTKDFIDNSQRLVVNYFLIHGFTTGMADAILPKKDRMDMRKVLEEKALEVQHLITEIENFPDLLDAETFEKQIYSILQVVSGELAKMSMKRSNSNNNFYAMIESKSKGSDLNFGKIVGGIGQGILQFKRILKKVNNRSLVHFTQNDDTAMGRGFIVNSFFSGLEPHEFYFDHMTGREGLIDTAIKSVTGDTKLVIMENGKTKLVNIGDWIDGILDANINGVQKYADRDMELFNINHPVSIPTTDENGKVTWGQITAVTRHDPGQVLYEIKTLGGRNVIVTESHSLLIWNGNQFLKKLTPEVVVGDFVPVTANLCEPPTINTHIDLTDLFPRTEVIHGTDFIKARTMFLELTERLRLTGRSRTPSGWWDQHNGTDFVLPYDKIQLFIRTLVRSNHDFIQEGCVYPFGQPKNDSTIKSKFEFTPENGLFLGLYIAEGHACVRGGTVCITNNDVAILDFVKGWFDRNNIKWRVDSKISNVGGRSTTIFGHSVYLGKILKHIAGHGARNKFIHPQIFSAPLEFIRELINGIISGDGCVTHNNIQIGSSSPRLITDLSMCLSRLNIFGKSSVAILKSNNVGTVDIAPINMLSIRANWAQTFQREIKLISTDKNIKLMNMVATDIHRNFRQHNDVVLDAIIEINKVDIAKYPKVYDLTIPSTLNFGLANGLHVVDTSDSGYLQRKLIKGMEDVYIAYDGTVRSGNNVMIQMLFADSHMDQAIQKRVKFNILKWGNKQIETICKFTEDQIKELNTNLKYTNEKKKELKDFNDTVVKIMKDYRDDFRDIQQKAKLSNSTLLEEYFQPANYNRIIFDAKNAIIKSDSLLDPLYIISELERLMDPRVCQIVCIYDDDIDLDSPKYYNQLKAKYLFKIALYEYLSPKRCIYEYKFNREKFDQVIAEIIKSYNKCMVESGEMVGVVASQSLGEPLTQMTLNSIDWNDRILYQTNNNLTMVEEIGLFVDTLMNNNQTNIQMVDNATETEYLDISNLNIKVPTVNQDGKTSWKLLEAVTRHLPGHDGKLVKIKTNLGREVTATKSKSFLLRKNNKLIDVDGDTIKIGDRLPVDISYIDPLNQLNNEYVFNDVYMDEIIELTYVDPSHPKVYDLTVAETRNFTMADGLCMRDTFHSSGSGVAGMQGIPRFRELLSYTKNPSTPYMVIYMDKQNLANKEHASRVSSTLKYTILSELAEQLDIIYDPDATTSLTSYYNVDDLDRETALNINNAVSNVDNSPWLFRVELSKESVTENEITMLDIKTKFDTFWKNNYSDLSILKKQEKETISKILHGSVITSYDSSDTLVIHFRFELASVDNTILSGIQDMLLYKFNIKGYQNISKISKIDNQQYISFDNEDQTAETAKEHVIYTEGIDMDAIRSLFGVDVNRTICNDVHKIYQMFGIEAARSALIKEYTNVFDGNNVNPAHIMLLCDVMTNTGGITSIDRHGINRLDTDPMGRASFEKTIEQLIWASAFNEVDYLRGVSSRIMVGRCIKGGTGLCDLVVDVDVIENSEIDETKEVKTQISSFGGLKTSGLLKDLIKVNRPVFMPN